MPENLKEISPIHLELFDTIQNRISNHHITSIEHDFVNQITKVEQGGKSFSLNWNETVKIIPGKHTRLI